MEAKKLEAKIEDWAANMGFTLPGDSAPPPHYFSLFTATPNRRQLWQVIIESIQDRRKIENIRKQLFVFSVKQGKKNKDGINSGKFSSKLDLYAQQKKLENKIMEKKNEIDNLEKKILTRTSDLLFDALKMIENQKQNDDLRKKALGLRLMNQQQNRFIEQLDKYLSFTGSYEENHKKDDLSELKDVFMKPKDEISNFKICKNDICHECPIQEKIDFLCKSGKTIDSIWDGAVVEKKEELEKFYNFLNELPHIDSKLPQINEEDSEENLKLSVENLKQEICFKSLQAMINDSETNLLEWEIQKIMQRIENAYFKLSEKSLNSNPSFLLDEEIGKSFEGNSNFLEEIKNQAALLGLKKYKEFLKCEISKLDNKILKEEEDFTKCRKGKEEYQQSLCEIDSLVQEVKDKVAERNELNSQLSQLLDRTKILMEDAENQVKNKNFVSEVEETILKLKINSKKQFEAFIKIPMDAIEMTTDTSTEKSRDCDLQICQLDGRYGGEFKQILKSLMINPFQSVESALKEIERRKLMSEELEKFIAEKKKLSEGLQEVLMKMSSLKYDSKAWEKNFEDCQKILCNILRQEKTVPEEIEFMEKILHNWLNQPYKSMIDESETVAGMTLKDYEDLHKKNKLTSQKNFK